MVYLLDNVIIAAARRGVVLGWDPSEWVTRVLVLRTIDSSIAQNSRAKRKLLDSWAQSLHFWERLKPRALK